MQLFMQNETLILKSSNSIYYYTTLGILEDFSTSNGVMNTFYTASFKATLTQGSN